MKLDNLHYDFRQIDGYKQPFKFVLSARELGKTTVAWVKKIYGGWLKDKRAWIYLTRQCVDISESAISTIENYINKFIDEFDGKPVTLKYSRGDLNKGICDVYIGKDLFFRFIALSIPLRRIKLAVLKGVKGVLIDEYIIDTRTGEKYIKDEAFKIKEAYTTWVRECPNLRFYFLANPYSLYNPIFMTFGVDTRQLQKGSFYTSDLLVIHYAEISEKLREKLLNDNPLYQFDDDYIEYALNGVAVNDRNVKIGVRDAFSTLKFVFKVKNDFFGVWRKDIYYVTQLDIVSKYRDIYCLDLSDLIDNSAVVSAEERLKLGVFKKAMATNNVVYENINLFYIFCEVFKHL